MTFKDSLYKDNWIFTKYSDYPDYIINLGEEILAIIQNNKIQDKTKYKDHIVTYGTKAICLILEEAGFKWSEMSNLFPLDKKNTGKLITLIYEKNDGVKAAWIMWLIQYTGFQIGTKYPQSYSPDNFKIPSDILKERNKLVSELDSGKIDQATFETKTKQLAEVLIKRMEKGGQTLADLMKSGSAKNDVSNIQRMLLSRGLSLNSKGEVNATVTTPLSRGASPKDYFNGSSEALVSQYKKSIETAAPGYLIRQMIDLLSGVRVSEIDNCGTKEVLTIKIKNKSMAESFKNRYDIKGNIINPKVGQTIKVRSPLYCKAKDGICMKCLGKDIEKLGVKKGDPLLVATTSWADAATGSALKAAHTGLSLNAKKVNFIEELKEVD